MSLVEKENKIGSGQKLIDCQIGYMSPLLLLGFSDLNRRDGVFFPATDLDSPVRLFHWNNAKSVERGSQN